MTTRAKTSLRTVLLNSCWRQCAAVLLAIAALGARPAAAQESIVASFTGTTGACPGSFPKYGNLIQASDGNFYGTTQNGGATGGGAVVQVTPTGTCTVLHSFNSASNADGAYPYTGVVEGTDGNLYGTTNQGGANGYGTVYQVSMTSPYTFTLMHSFSSALTDGATPYGALVQGTDGNFYGMTEAGGASAGSAFTAGGTVFKISPTAPYAFVLIHSFSGGTNNTADGAAPYDGLVQGADGNFYGTTTEGGAGNFGAIFQISPTSPCAFTLIHSFTDTDGQLPYDPLVQGADGDFYGTTIEGGNGYGVVFKVSPASPYPYAMMHSFTSADGARPTGPLFLGTDGNYYGTTYAGGTSFLDGTMFSIGATSPYPLTQLHNFTYGVTTDGAQPDGGLVQGADGNFYGTTYYGGTGGNMAGGYDGTVFKFVPATTLPGPVALTVPASVTAGAAYTLSYSVFNAYSSTLQQCVANNNAGDTTWAGIYAGSPIAANVKLTAPSAAGSYTYTLTCGGMEYGFTTLVVTGAPSAVLTPSSVPFGNQAVNMTSGTQVIVLSNPGTATLNITSITLGGTSPNDFGLTSACGATLAAGSSCNISVDFTPASATSFSASVNVVDDATDSPQSAALSGTGFASTPPTLTPASLTFAPAAIGSGDDSMFATLTNPGTTALTGITITFTGADATDFSTYPTGTCGTTLAANSSCTIAVRFYPSAVGTRTATLNVAQSGTAQPLTTTLTGIGLAAPVGQIQFFPAQLNYVAGNGMHPAQCNDTGDNGPATSAELCQPYGAAMDAAGNTYVVDYGDNVIKKIDTNGIITTFAGVEGLAGGFGGDGGPATSATFSGPVAIAFDSSGNAYISDSGNGRIREVSAATGTITTFVGGGPGVYFTPGTSGTSVALLQPGGLTFDPSGNLYIAVDGQQIVAKVTPAGVATLFAGVLTMSGPGAAGYNGDNIPANTAELNSPQQVASDPRGDIFIADSGNYRIREVDAVTGTITTVAGNGTQGDTGDGGPATSAEIVAEGVAVDLAGDVYSSNAGTIRKVNVDTGNILTVAGGGTGPVGGAANGAGISTGLPAVDNFGNVLIPDGESGQAALLSEGSTGFLQFGSEPVGSTTAPLTVTIFNVGDSELDFASSTFTATGDFTVTGGSCVGTEGPGAAGCTLTVTFTPTATGTRTGAIQVESNSVGGGLNTILLSGTGTNVTAPVASLSPTTVAFGSQTVNTTSTAQTVMLSNTGNATLNISGITLTGANPADFTISANTCGATLAASASCSISVNFTPASATSFTATLSVADDAAGSPQTASLTGTGTAVPAPIATLTPSTLAFGNQTAGTTATAMSTTLSNSGNATLNISGITLTGANPSDFAISASTCGATLAASASCTISVTFTPASATSFAATLSAADDAAGSPQTVALSGTGTAVPAPIASLTPSTVSFPVTTVNATSAAQMLTLSNTGNATLNISSITLTGANTADFAISANTCGATLAPSANCAISVTFTPASATSFTATLSVADDAAGSPQTAALSGTGQIAAADFSVAATNPTQSVAAGTAAQFSLNVTGIGGNYNLPVTLSVTGLPAGATASFTPPSVIPGSSGAVSVLSVTTPSLTGALLTPPSGHSDNRLPLLALLVLPLLGIRNARRRLARCSGTTRLLLLAAIGLAAMLPLTGCGGGYFGPVPHTYTLTVTGTSGNLQHSTTITLTVQ